MQSEKKYERASYGREERAILTQEGANGAGGSAKGNEHERETRDERERGGKETGARRLPLT
jgi:hypothetical protein